MNTYTDLISVIIPVYKTEAFLSRCVDSVLNQTYPNLEIILVDDGSPDKSGELCDLYAERDARVSVIHKTNGGLSSARNAGLAVARGKYVGFVDSDDWVAADMFDRMHRVAVENHTGIVRCGIRRANEYAAPCAGQEGAPVQTLDLKDSAISVWTNGFMCNKLFRSDLFSNVRFDETISYVEDSPVLLELLIKNQGMVSMEQEMYYYYLNPDSITGQGFNLRKLSSLTGFQRMNQIVTESVPELHDYFMSHYLMVCIGFYLHKEVRADRDSKKMIQAILRKEVGKAMGLKNMKWKFKAAMAIFCLI